MNIAVLGAGMVGRVMALDLAKEHSVTSIDVNENNLQSVLKQNANIKTIKADLKDYAPYKNLLLPYNLIVTAVPGFMGFDTLKAVIECGKDVADISFFPENALELDAVAKEKKVTVITDCGVAPGMSNYIIGRYNEEIKIDAFEIYVGGENLTNYFQKNVIIAADEPFGEYFDASMVWGPVSGRLVYGGFRYKIK